MAEKARILGNYAIQEHTARRLVAEARSAPLVIIGGMWGAFVVVAVLIGPWRGGTRLFIALTAAVLLIGVTALLVRFLPTRRRVLVDCEAGEYRIERDYLFPQRTRTVRVPLDQVRSIRRRRQVWQDSPSSSHTEWVVELVGENGEVWTAAVGEEEPMAELARLLAEVGTCPLEEA